MDASNSSQAAGEALLKLLKQAKEDEETHGYQVSVVDDNIHKWHVKLSFEPTSQIGQDLFMYEATTGNNHVLVEIIFPATYPSKPFFIRVCYPRFHQYTGHITIGGSLCIEELTSTGWNPEFEIQTFIIMIRNLLVEGGALINMDQLDEYSEEEAISAFNRVAQQHGISMFLDSVGPLENLV